MAWEGYVTLLCSGAGPCYRCLFPEAPAYESQRVAARVGIMGTVAGIIGQLMAEQAVAALVGNLDAMLVQRMLSFDGKKTSFCEIKLRGRSKKCPICGDNPTIKRAEEVDYDSLCNLPIRELKEEERIDFAGFREILAEQGTVGVVDTRERPRFEQIAKAVGAIHCPIFELKKRKERAEEIVGLIKTRKVGKSSQALARIVICIAYNKNDAKYGAEALAAAGIVSGTT